MLVAELTRVNADVIALQESALGPDGSHADELASHLAMQVCSDRRPVGLALLSRLPIESVRSLDLHADSYGYPAPLVVELGTAIEYVTCIVLHLPLARSGDRSALVAELSRVIARVRSPLVVCGDLNAEPSDRLVAALLATGLADVSAAAGPTMPNPDPQVRLDYILVRSLTPVIDAEALGAAPDPDGFLASDHLGVAVELELEPDPASKAAMRRR